MPLNAFDRLDRIASRTIDSFNSTRFILTPMAKGGNNPNSRAGLDSSRPVVAGRCVFENVSDETGIQLGVRKSYRESNDFRALRTTRSPVASVDRHVYFPDGKIPRQGDVIQFPDHVGSPTYEISSSQPDGHSRVVMELVMRGEATPSVGERTPEDPPVDPEP